MFGKNFYKLKYSSKPFFFLSRYSFTFKNNRIFTICFIGRPNVGKSTLMNALSGERISLVDNIPGLTRDRKEGIIKLFDVKLKLVDTAGVDNLDEKLHTDVLLNESVNQTRKALVQSDLAFFIVDARAGITEEDISLSNWINERKSYNSKMKELEENLENISKEQNINNEEKEKLYENYKKMKLSKDVTIPPIKLIINKAENNFRGNEIDIDYYKLNLGEPIYISAEHGDNMHDVYKIIQDSIPEEYHQECERKIGNRIKRYRDYKEKLYSDFMNYTKQKQIKDEDMISKAQWEKEFDENNLHDIEDNSDFDSDNEIDPLDYLITKLPDKGEKTSKGVSSDNPFKKRKINISIIGRTNVGKSSIINTLLKENRVIVSDVSGTTRDCVPIEWIYKGRRVLLVDTAGLKAKNKCYNKIDRLISAATIRSIKFCHVVIYVIDSMEAFTTLDLKILNYIGEEGRAVVFVSNKWDLIENSYKLKAKKWIENQLKNGTNHYKNFKIIFCSAKTLIKVDEIMDEVLYSYESWNSRISTGVLNDWLNEIKKVKNTPVEIHNTSFYLFNKVKTRPPTFSVFINSVNKFIKSYDLFLKKMILQEFNLRNIPVRFLLRDKNSALESNPFKKVSISTARITKKVELKNTKLNNPTYRRRLVGARKLQGNSKLNNNK